MKQKDIAMLIVIVFISGIISFVISNFTFGKATNRQQTAETVDVIVADFKLPGPTYFNTSSVDPTQLIQIQDNNNANPFAGSQ